MAAPIDKIILMLIQGVPAADIEAAHDRLGMTVDQARAAILEARKKITIAADFNRDEQIAIAFTRLNDLYGKSSEIDPKVALAAQKELNKLLSLYSGPKAEAGQPGGTSSESAAELERVASHLLPLNLAPDTYPIAEHARLAAGRIRDIK